MNSDQIFSAIRSMIVSLMGWVKLVAAVMLTLLVTATLSTALGHPIPFIPAFKGSMQEIGIFTAAVAYFLK